MEKDYKYVTGYGVDDHVIALYLLSRKGIVGETYCIGGGTELSNIDLAELICKKLDEIKS